MFRTSAPGRGRGGVQCCARFISNKISLFALKKFLSYSGYSQLPINSNINYTASVAKQLDLFWGRKLWGFYTRKVTQSPINNLTSSPCGPPCFRKLLGRGLLWVWYCQILLVHHLFFVKHLVVFFLRMTERSINKGNLPVRF